MKLSMKKLALGLMMTGGFAGHALAAGTTAGEVIENGATLSFQTTTGQSLSIDSSPTGNSNTDGTGGLTTDFLVDRKLDIEVVQQDAELVSVAPDGTAFLSFKVFNRGNDTQDILLTANNLATADADTDVTAATSGGPDNNDALSFKICTTLPVGDPLDCTAVTSLDNVAEDGEVDVYVLATMQDDTQVANADLILFSLQAQVATTAGVAIATDDGAATDDPSVVQNVFAETAGPGTDGAGTGDAVYDGFHSDIWAFIIVEANVTVTKTAIAVWDPFSCDDDADPDTAAAPPTAHTITTCTGDNPKAIPGAYLEYTITITNATGAADAESLSISDLVDDSEVTFVTDAYNDDAVTCTALLPCGIYVVQPFTTGGAEPAGEAHTNANDGLDASNFGATPNTVTSAPDDLAGNQTTIVKFRVEIQ